jgi:hypothetical protein
VRDDRRPLKDLCRYSYVRTPTPPSPETCPVFLDFEDSFEVEETGHVLYAREIVFYLL